MITLSSNCLTDAHAEAFDKRSAEPISAEQMHSGFALGA